MEGGEKQARPTGRQRGQMERGKIRAMPIFWLSNWSAQSNMMREFGNPLKKTKLRKNNWAKFLPRLAAFCETGQINIFPAWTQQQLTVEARTEQSGDEKSSCQEFAHGNLPGCVFFFLSFFDVNLRMTSVFIHISQSVRSHMKPPLSFRINYITVKAQSHFRFVSLHLISSCPSYRIELVVEISPCDTRQPFKTLVCHQLSSIDATGRFQSSAVVIRPVQQWHLPFSS